MEPDTLPDPRSKKRKHVTMRSSKIYKKEFDTPPSSLMNHPLSSSKCMPFKSMVIDWWLQSHSKVKTLNGATWLMRFHSSLKEDDLHPTNREYLKELVSWHEEKKGGQMEEESGQSID